jgi:hypothetical protein
MLRKILVVLLILCLALAMLWVKAFVGSMKAFEEGEKLLKGSERIRAVTYYDRSLHWYAPGNPYVGRSAQRLWEISKEAEEEGDIRLALISLRTIRRGFYRAEHLYQPGKRWIDRCELKIQALLALEEVSPKSGKREGWKDAENRQMRGYSSPDVFWSLVVEMGFLGWIGSALCLIVAGFPDKRSGKKKIGGALTWSSLLVVFFCLWVIGMAKA